MAAIKFERIFFKRGNQFQLFYDYFNKWSKDGSFRQIGISFLKSNKRKLDLSCVQFDGSDTRSRIICESIGY